MGERSPTRGAAGGGRQRPLAGRTIVVTRPAGQAEQLARPLEQEGARVLRVPAIAIVPVAIDEAWRGAAARLGTYDLVVFTSANGVGWFVDRLAEVGVAVERLQSVELVAIGPATAAALNVRGLTPACVPDDYVAEGIIAALERRGRPLAGARVLIPRAKEARSTLPDGLGERGAVVDVLPVYETVPAPALAQPPAVIERADYITFTSGSTVDGFVVLMDPTDLRERLAGARLCSIGPITTQALERHGLPVAVEAAEYTGRGLVKAIVADA